MNVWLVVVGEPLPQEPGSRALRTRVLARALAARGHRVRWWTSDFNHFLKRYHTGVGPDEDSAEGYRLSYLHGRPYARNISMARLLNHRQIARDYSAKAENFSPPDVVVCCFPPIELAQAVAAYCKDRGVPLIVDVRDLWPDELAARLPRQIRPLAPFLLRGMTRSVRRTMRAARAIVGVSDRYLSWGLAHAGRQGRSRDCVIPLGYPDHPESAAMRGERRGNTGDPACHFFFSGSFNQSVDVASIIDAFRRLPQPGLRLTLCGDGDNYRHFVALADGDPRIRFTGWIGAETLRMNARTSRVGLVSYRPESLVAMPNKFFEYLSFGLPIINSIPGEASDIVAANAVGLNYRAGDSASLLQAMSAMADDPARRHSMAVNAAHLYESTYAASTVYDRYCMLIEDIADRASGGAGL